MNPMPSLSADQSLNNIQNVLANAEFQLLQAQATLAGAQAAAGAVGSDSSLKGQLAQEQDGAKAQVARYEAVVAFYQPIFEKAKTEDDEKAADVE